VARCDSGKDSKRLTRRSSSTITTMASQLHFEIRLAAPEDAGAISRVLHESFIEFKPLYTPGGFAATALAVEQVLQRINEGPIWIASCDRLVVGTIAAVAKGESGYIRGMAVLPSARGTGIAATLLREAERWAADMGFRHVFLSTTPFLTAAIRFYEKSGFCRRDNSLHDLFGTPLFTMQKTLTK
jgi:GNAT superfamily N-acetyltransferase